MSVFNLPMTPYPIDGIPTETSTTQAATESLLLSILHTSPPPPLLQKSLHTQYLAKHIFALPEGYVSLDASRPWLIYWALHSLDVLGVALDQGTKDRAVATILSFQHPNGGFAGGPGQSPHLLPTYAALMSLMILSQPSSFKQINLPGLYDFYMRCKVKDGSGRFVVCEGGEVDVRGIYCVLVGATVTGLMTEELVDGVDKFIASCQTYEGGFSSSSFPFPTPTPHSSPLNEAHGGYTSCALLSHFLLRPYLPSLAPINTPNLLRWAVQQQGLPTELGGFRGRTNKLVDGCYSWWVGGLFPVITALTGIDAGGGEEEEEEGRGWAMEGDKEGEEELRKAREGRERRKKREMERREEEGDEGWEEVEREGRMLYNRVALQEYVIIAAQSDALGQISKGGLRDKPGKSPDLYHTSNNLSGLSTAQHLLTHSPTVARRSFTPASGPAFLDSVNATLDEGEVGRRRREVYAWANGWVEDESGFWALGGDDNKVNTTHPVFNVLTMRVKPFMDFFYGQGKSA